jgi:hypothetical protein
MTNQEAWAQYKEYSHTTSEIARKFAFAGIAICWFFKSEENKFSEIVLLALILFVIYFLFDLLQYLVSSFLYKNWIRKSEIKKWEQTGKIEGDYYNPTWIDVPAFILFILKIIILLTAFLIIGYWLFIV